MRQILLFCLAVLLATSTAPAIAGCTEGDTKCGADGYIYRCMERTKIEVDDDNKPRFIDYTIWVSTARICGARSSSRSGQLNSVGNWIANYTVPVPEAGVLQSPLPVGTQSIKPASPLVTSCMESAST